MRPVGLKVRTQQHLSAVQTPQVLEINGVSCRFAVLLPRLVSLRGSVLVHFRSYGNDYIVYTVYMLLVGEVSCYKVIHHPKFSWQDPL
jgi:hypothetical protein